jgi:hypothetical protein
MASAAPGRGCPVSYRYGAEALAAPATLRVDTLWVAGGLYGNTLALERLAELAESERHGRSAVVFNGDFHWFDVDPETYRRVNETVLRHRATRGNVETELARPASGAGCGCGYPDWVTDEDVARSNRIIERLRATARAQREACTALAALPMYLLAEVAGERIAVVHGDADSLAGWGFSQEVLATPRGAVAAREAFARAGVRVFASSHTCLPVLQRFEGEHAVVNNGAAGMPNFRGTCYGLATRISGAPSGRALYAARVGALFVEALPIEFDAFAWRKLFLAQWPVGSDAHASYYARLVDGPRFSPDRALRVEEAMA